MHSFDFSSAILAVAVTVLVVYFALRKLGYRVTVRIEHAAEPVPTATIEEERLRS